MAKLDIQPSPDLSVKRSFKTNNDHEFSAQNNTSFDYQFRKQLRFLWKLCYDNDCFYSIFDQINAFVSKRDLT